MSILQLDDVATHTLHIVQLLGAACELQLTYFNPIHGEVRPLPRGPKVVLSTGSQLLSEASVADDGRVSLQTLNFATRVHIGVDFGLHTHLDLEAETFVGHADVQAIDPRALIEMPAIWDSRKQAEFSDNLGGRFSTGALAELLTDQQGTPDAPWVLQIDFAWRKLYLRFDYYDPISDAHAAVPYGWRVHATSTVVGAPKLGSGSVIRDDGLVYLPLVHAEQPTRVRLLAGLPALSVIDLAEPDLRKRIKQLSPEDYDGLAPDLRDEAYPLPTVWHARNQLATRSSTSATFEAFAEAATTPNEPIAFHLDDFVLVNETAQPRVRFDQSLKLTMFDHLLAIRDQDPDEPYLTHGDFPENHFSGRSLYAVTGQGASSRLRVIRRGDAFYDITRHRTIRGPLVGVRSAVRNDHPHESKQHYLHRHFGNYDLHYFHDCTLLNGRLLSHILVHWSCRFVPVDNASFVVPAGETDAFKKALLAAQHRWQGEHPAFNAPGAVPNPHGSSAGPARPKNYTIRAERDAAPHRDIKVYFHFRASDEERVKCTVDVLVDQRANMGLRRAAFSIDDRHAPPPPHASLNSVDALDGKAYEFFTLAHELGHAMGLPDEYLEQLKLDTPTPLEVRLPLIAQGTGRARHLGADVASIMNFNTGPRLRHFWPYARWLEENPSVQGVLGMTTFIVEYARPSGTASGDRSVAAPSILRYRPPSSALDYRTPFAEEPGFRHNGRRMDLALYFLGQDESVWKNLEPLLDGFDAVLLVTIKLHFRFVANANGNGWGTGPAARMKKARPMVAIEEMVRAFSGDRTPSGPKPAIVVFETLEDTPRRIAVELQCRYALPRGEELHKASPAPPPSFLDAHHHIRFRPATGTFKHDVADLARSHHTRKRVDLVDGEFSDGTECTPASTFLRFMLGLPTTNAAGAPPTIFKQNNDALRIIRSDELRFLEEWLEQRLQLRVVTRRISAK
jgi:hypothetical protein